MKPELSTKNKIQCAIWWEYHHYWVTIKGWKKWQYNRKRNTMAYQWFEEIANKVILPMPEHPDRQVSRK